MSNLARWNPWRQLREMARFDPFEEMNEMFRSSPLAAVTPQMRVDIEENTKSYLIKAELPGVKKEDINVAIDGNRVSISAECRQEKDEKNDQTLRSERYYGQVFRSFTLDADVDSSKAEAKFDNGVLRLSLPKTAGENAHRLAIQ